MRHRLAPFIALLLALSAIVAACGGAATSSDPYQILTGSMKATWSPVQVNVGFDAKDGATSVSIDPSAFGFVVDRDAGTGALHVSVPIGALGLDASALAGFGITGTTVDLDVLYDGQALYGRSPVFAKLLTMILKPSGDLPAGDLSGWLRLGTKEDLAGLAGSAAAGGDVPSFAIPSAGDAVGLKAALENAGVTLSGGTVEKHDGADAYHLKVAIDGTKFLANKAFDAISRAQTQQMADALRAVTLSGDLWIDKASNHIAEFDGHVVATKDATQTATMTVKFGSPDGTIPTTAPSTFVEIPIKSIVSNVMTLIGQGLTGG